MQNIADILEEQSTPTSPLNTSMVGYMQSYVDTLSTVVMNAKVTDQYEEAIEFEMAMAQTIALLDNPEKTIYIVGNGGSAGIASHMATDFLKNGKLPALYLGDAAMVTCISNDLGYQEVYSTPIRQLMREEDVLIAISSSGNSANILNAVNAAQSKGAKAITFSGFKKENALRKMGDVNWYIESPEYGIVENAHQILIHAFLDKIMLDR